MKRSYLFFMFFLLWESARGFGVWNELPAQIWHRSEEKTIQDPPSLSSEQQANSVPSGVQSIEHEATNSDGSSNAPTRHVRLKPNGLGVSSFGDELHATDAQSAGRPSSPTPGFQSPRPSKHFILSSPRRLYPSSLVGLPARDSLLPQQNGYSSGFASGRPSTQMPPHNANNAFQSMWSQVLSSQSASRPTFQSWMSNLVAPSNGFISNTFSSPPDHIGNDLSGYSNGLFSARKGSQTQYDPPLQIQKSNRVATFQNSGSTSLPLQQAGYSDQSKKDWLEVKRIPFGSEAPSQSLGRVPVQSQQDNYGIPSKWSAFQLQGIPSASRPALQTQPSDFVAPSRTVGSAPVPSQEDNLAQPALEVQRILLTSRPTSQAQSSNFLTPSQISGSAPVPLQQDGYGIPSWWSTPQVQGIPSVSQLALKKQQSNLVVPSQSLVSAPVPPWQESYGMPSRWSSSQVQGIPSASRPLLQNQPLNFVLPSQSLGSAPVPSQQDGYGIPSWWSAPEVLPSASWPALQTQPSYILAPSQGLGSAQLQSQQDRDGFQSRWPAAEIKSIFLNRPRFQNQASNLVAPSQSVAVSPQPLQEDRYGFQSWSSGLQMQGIPSATLPVLQTQPSNLVAPFQSLGSAPVPSPQDGDSFYTRWPAAEIPNVPSSAQPIFQGRLSDIVASHEHLSGASLPSQHNRYGPESSFFNSKEQNIARPRWPERVPSASQPPQFGPMFQTQASQERTSVFSSLSQNQARVDPSEHVLCFKVSSAALADAVQSNKPGIQPQSLESLQYNSTASSSLPSSSQSQNASALTAAQTQSGVQSPAVNHSSFLPSSQTPANSTASAAKSVSTPPVQTSAEHLASDLSKQIPGDVWTELTERDLD